MIYGFQSEGEVSLSSACNSFFSDCPTGFRIDFSEAGSSGKSIRKGKPRKGSHLSKRRQRVTVESNLAITSAKKEGDLVGNVVKRKAEGKADEKDHLVRCLKKLIVLIEGLSNPQ